jgi:hypothetical protein
LSATNSTQWFWSDWAGDPCVRRLTPAERGLWIDLLNYAATGAPVGYVCDQHGNPISYEEIARFTNATPTEVATLIDGILAKGAASRDRTGRLFNRRMVRQAELSVKRKNAGKGGGKATQLKWREYQSLAQQVPRTLPGHRVPVPLPKESKITTSFSEAARASAEGSSQLVASLERVQESVRVGHPPGRPHWIDYGTIEWTAHEHFRRSRAFKPMVSEPRVVEGVERRGAWVESRVPPNYDEATGERIAPKDEAAA